MASIQEDVTREAWDLFLRFLQTGTTFVCSLSHEGNVFIKQTAGPACSFAGAYLVSCINRLRQQGEPADVVAQMLKREQKGETIRTMMVADEDAFEIMQLFKKHGVLCYDVDNPNDDTKAVLYMSGDREKVENVISIWNAERGHVSEIGLDLFLNYYSKEGVGTFSGLDKADLEMFRRFAKKNHLVFTSYSAEADGKYVVVYNTKDRALARKTMDATVWAFSGELGNDLKDRVFDLIKNRERLIAAFTGKEKEFYIVNSKDPENYIHVTANDVTYFKKGKLVAAIDNPKDNFERVLFYIDAMDSPVLVKCEEFEVLDGLGQPDKDAVARTVQEKAKKLPDHRKILEDQEAQNERLERIQSKMALDDENTAGFWIYADDIDFDEGGVYEIREDIDEQTKTDIMDARKRAAKFKIHEVSAVDQQSLDYFIAEAEKHRATSVQEQQQVERAK